MTRSPGALPPNFWTQLHTLWQISSPMLRTRRIAGLLGLMVLLAIASGGFLVWESIQRGEFISALAARDAERFQRSLITFIGILIGSALLLSLSAFVRDTAGLRWRQGLNRQFLETYLADRHYYRLTLPSAGADIDNPDQRLSEDIRLVTQTTLIVIVIALESGVQLIGFLGVLWALSTVLTGVLMVYAGLGTAIALLFFGKRLTRINAEQLKREATFRFGLINVRENAESIAFYQGQQAEGTLLNRSFTAVVANFNRLIRWQLGLDFFQNSYQYLTFILPSVILAPSILAGQLEVGAIVQSQAAFDRIWLSLSLIVVQFELLTTLAASIGRLSTLAESLQALQQAEPTSIQQSVGPTLSVQDLTVLTPNGQRCLCEELSLEVPPESNLLVVGPSGVGKSALMKTLSGIWTAGEGILKLPADSLFLPQQPYLTLGSLRQQLLYPHGNDTATPESLVRALTQVELLHLAQLPLDTVDDWSQRLSLGEQQRLSFARLLLQRPAYAILDEATSAVSMEQEQALYQQLVAAGITAISVGHRPSLLTYHTQVLTLSPDRSWSLHPTQEAPLA
ncbi:ABC transporter ATP-binding protein/permease [Oscillatoria sp. CS-180]|uniref:ABC transporter ATP-binding protein/permease n=1 Tax=Oscillatoria sp. CS-180 TaxID=3021720 RepID=UPI002330D803|nr:ABC transporter ATP-binding protein/permease [Oscillatoria sp. CS-180]MDB9529360.1 ABC transporter ATP-binding protein/permease [Oscillatoria sp. CS-180]